MLCGWRKDWEATEASSGWVRGGNFLDLIQCPNRPRFTFKSFFLRSLSIIDLSALEHVGAVDADGFLGGEEVERERRRRLIGIICRGFAQFFADG